MEASLTVPSILNSKLGTLALEGSLTLHFVYITVLTTLYTHFLFLVLILTIPGGQKITANCVTRYCLALCGSSIIYSQATLGLGKNGNSLMLHVFTGGVSISVQTTFGSWYQPMGNLFGSE